MVHIDRRGSPFERSRGHFEQRIPALQQVVNQGAVQGVGACSDGSEDVFHRVGQSPDSAKPQETRGAFDGMHGAEDGVKLFACARLVQARSPLQHEQAVAEDTEVFRCLLSKLGIESGEVHGC